MKYRDPATLSHGCEAVAPDEFSLIFYTPWKIADLLHKFRHRLIVLFDRSPCWRIIDQFLVAGRDLRDEFCLPSEVASGQVG